MDATLTASVTDPEVDVQGTIVFRYVGDSPPDRPLLQDVIEALRQR